VSTRWQRMKARTDLEEVLKATEEGVVLLLDTLHLPHVGPHLVEPRRGRTQKTPQAVLDARCRASDAATLAVLPGMPCG
jgi:hypothetical protein